MFGTALWKIKKMNIQVKGYTNACGLYRKEKVMTKNEYDAIPVVTKWKWNLSSKCQFPWLHYNIDIFISLEWLYEYKSMLSFLTTETRH